MTTSPPNAWAWLDGRDVPVSIDSLNLSVSDTLREQNDNPDPTYQDCWPSERYPSDGDQCPECKGEGISWYDIGNDMDSHEECRTCHGAGVRFGRETPRKLRVGARNEHPACDVSKMGNFPVTGNITVTAPETTAPADSFAVESCPECGTVTDIEYGETDNPLLNHMECTFNSCMDIAVAKNEGYAGSSDPMANFNDSVRLGVPVPIGVALRLSDKWARLCRLLQTGENPLADEPITDTIMDAVNYLAILLYALDTGSVETSTVTDKCRGSGT